MVNWYYGQSLWVTGLLGGIMLVYTCMC